MKILAVGAHFDDIEIGCAGTIMKHLVNKDDVYFAITHTGEHRTGDVSLRIKEQGESLKIFGLGQGKIHLFEETDSDAKIIATLDKIKADVVFSPYENDTHQHHRRSSTIAQAVSRKRHMTTLFYDSGSTYDFYPNVFSEIVFERKLQILRCFKSQIEHGAINVDIVQKKNSYWASLITDKPDIYAEGFVARKMIWEI